METESGEDRQAQRRKRTLYLVIGGVLSLLLPLLGVLYLKLANTSAPAADLDPSAVFAHRDGARLQPAGAAAAPTSGPGALPLPAPKAPPSAPASGAESGLSMIRGGEDYYQQSAAPAPAPAPPTPAAAPKPVPIPQPKTVAQPAAPAKPSFSFARLKPQAGFGKSWFSSNQAQTSARTSAQAQSRAAPAGAPAGAGGQTPDLNALMNSMGGAAGAAAGGGTAPAPDVSKLLQNVPTPPSQ